MLALYQTNALILDLYSGPLKQQQICGSTRTQYPDCESTSICSYSIMLSEEAANNTISARNNQGYIYISKQQLYNNYTWIIKICFLAVIFIGPLSHTIGPLRGCGTLALGNFYYILYYMERAQFLTRQYMFSLHHQVLENIISISYLTYIFVLIVGMSALL